MVQKYFRLINEILPNLKKSNNILDILLHTKIKTILSSSIYLNDSIYNILNLFITTNYKELNDIVITYKENIEYVFNKIKDYKLIDFGYNIYNNEYEYDGNPIKKRKNYNDSIISESFIDDMFSDISKYYETKNTDEKLYLEETNKNESQAVFIINKQKEIYDKYLPQNVIKVAEASFSEVFKCKSQIYKIIPLNNEFTQKKDFYKECFIHKILSCEKGICPLINFYIVKGKYTKRYLKAWDNFGFEENERPDKHNLFGVIVSEDGGICLEKYKFKSVKQILFFVRQIIQILSNLEIKYKFEHRDLHWGNILIKKKK
ncbi:haspin ser thr kinase [Vairimorpha apis BRL 01]|uniref:Haspin ser thr kinase n=1 Tax=Vairimorpha apis BRL 01 TaxID=1037528 RepID=T0L7T7_9MICR|nr:haspin ser thr kinase [Vairimorpha apis BRL 01]